MIDHVESAHPKKVKYLNFREALERLNKNLLAGQPLRTPIGADNGVRLLDLNNDGFLDVVIGNSSTQKTRVWNESMRQWIDSDFPARIVTGEDTDNGARFGVIRGGAVSLLLANESQRGAWTFDGARWKEDLDLLTGLEGDRAPVVFARQGQDRGGRFRDVDHDGACELIVSNESQNSLFQWDPALRKWSSMEFSLPAGASIVNAEGQDNGLRFVDVNEDGFDDVLFSNESRYSLHLFYPELHLGFARGWSRQVSAGDRSDPDAIPAVVRSGPNRNNGAWFHSQSLWVQNEDTAHLPDLVQRRTFGELLVGSTPEPKSPADALKSFLLPPGFRIELVAAEPMVVDPVSFEWDAQGRLWVAEMRDYPSGIDGRGKAGGVIKILTDTDKDGRHDQASEFLQGVNFPTGVMPWRNGALVSAAPDLIYAEDTNGDGVADLKKVLVSGFAPGNQQHRFNGFTAGLDGWIYGANGDSGGTLKVLAGVLNSSAVPPGPLRLRGDFRFQPDTGALQVIEGPTQYGRRRDDWDNWFGNNNPSWLWHYYLPIRYTERNQDLRIADLRVITPENNNLFPVGKTQQRFNDIGKGNTASAANSPTPYRDDLFGPAYASSVFISDPSFNLIHREVLSQDGVSFKSHRAPEERDREFLASTDTWFRPVTVKVGPDGALHFADMYRFVIEHPEWIPADVQKNMNLRAGEDKGRIYRVVPEGATLRPIPNLRALPVEELVGAMDSPNGWQRDTVQQLLAWQPDSKAPELLRQLIRRSPRPAARSQALWTLQVLGAASPADAAAALKDSDPRVRRQAVRVLELVGGPADAIITALKDADEGVVFQAALTAGQFPSEGIAVALADAARQRANDGRFQNAVRSSVRPMLPFIFDDLATHPPSNPAEMEIVSEYFSYAGGADLATQRSAIAALEKASGPWRFSAFGSLLDSVSRRQGTSEKLISANPLLASLFAAARDLSVDTGAAENDRMLAIRVLGSRPEDLPVLRRLLAESNSPALRKSALVRLGNLKDPQVADAIIEAWDATGPGLRQDALGILFTRQDWIGRLLDAVEKGAIPQNVIDPSRQQSLRTHLDPLIATRAQRIFAESNSDRRQVVAAFASAKDLRGDTAAGAILFRQTCAPCHRFRDDGFALGPDLGSVAAKPFEYLLNAILDPNQAVETRYLAYTASLNDGSEFSGILTAETGNSVTLSAGGDARQTILRADLKSLRGSTLSIMPDGLENTLTPQGMADLIGYLRTAARAPSNP